MHHSRCTGSYSDEMERSEFNEDWLLKLYRGLPVEFNLQSNLLPMVYFIYLSLLLARWYNKNKVKYLLQYYYFLFRTLQLTCTCSKFGEIEETRYGMFFKNA